MSQTKALTKPTQQTGPLAEMASRFRIEPDKLLNVLKSTVLAPKKSGDRAASNEEIAAFLMVANEYGLNPLTGEITGFVSFGKIVPVVTLDGWAKLVNTNPDFDGVDFDIEEEGGKPVQITCRMWVKGREHPVTVPERYRECYRNTGPWNELPFRMLRHKAFIQCARIAFGLHSIYDQDDASDIRRHQRVEHGVEVSSSPPAKAQKVMAQIKAVEAKREPEPSPPPEPESPDTPPPAKRRKKKALPDHVRKLIQKLADMGDGDADAEEATEIIGAYATDAFVVDIDALTTDHAKQLSGMIDRGEIHLSVKDPDEGVSQGFGLV